MKRSIVFYLFAVWSLSCSMVLAGMATTPLASLTAGGTNSYDFGISVAPAGDVNGDGYADVIVGDRFWDETFYRKGRAYVFYGGPDGPDSTPDWIVTGWQDQMWLGCSVAGVGDVNGDGYDDVVVGADCYDAGEDNEGAAFLYLGSSNGLSTTYAWMGQGNMTYAYYGEHVAPAGDVNGDGYDDVVVCMPNYRQMTSPYYTLGRVFVYYGSTGGLSAGASWTQTGTQDNGEFGRFARTAGDLNGDGYADLAIGAPSEDSDFGRVYLYLGSSGGLSSSAVESLPGPGNSSSFGEELGAAGDVNGDGYGDLIVGAPGVHPGGRAVVYRGTSSGIDTNSAWQVDGTNWLGSSVYTAGDVNDDGYADVVIGAAHSARVYHGSNQGLSTNPAWYVFGDQDGDGFGLASSIAGDVNGDGFADIIIGAKDWGADNGGAAFIYAGAADGLVSNVVWTREGDADGEQFAYAAVAVGDVNGDGYGDILVGVPNYGNGESNEGEALLFYGSETGLSDNAAWQTESDHAGWLLGNSVGGGDVNGDGYADLVVGVPDYANGENNEGALFIYFGGTSGPSTSADQVVEVDIASQSLGLELTAGGDVNGDGYADVFAFAQYSDYGAVYGFYGSADGVSTDTWDWRAVGTKYNGLWFGHSLDCAGDVNADGYADLVLGHYMDGDNSEGKTYVFHGSVTGLGAVAATVIVGPSNNAHSGWSVGMAGDVNGDGYTDILVGSKDYDSSVTDVGLVQLFLGSAGGVSTTACWSKEGGAYQEKLGECVAGAGDVNGDGRADILFSSEGVNGGDAEVYMIPGSPAGVETSQAWMITEPQHDSAFGETIGSAGDVNGDGLAELLVCARRYNVDADNDREGKLYIYYPNQESAMRHRLRQIRVGDSIPVAPQGVSDAVDGFRVSMFTRSPFGVDQVKLQWEAAWISSLYESGSASTGISPEWADTGLTGTALTVRVQGLPGVGAYRWCTRAVYRNARVFGIRYGRWMHLARHGGLEQAVKVGGVSLDVGEFNVGTDGVEVAATALDGAVYGMESADSPTGTWSLVGNVKTAESRHISFTDSTPPDVQGTYRIYLSSTGR